MKKTILDVYFRSGRCDKSSGAYLQHEVTKRRCYYFGPTIRSIDCLLCQDPFSL